MKESPRDRFRQRRKAPAMPKFSPVDQERLDTTQHLASRLLTGLKARSLKGKALERMKLVEQAVTYLEAARLT